MPKIEVKNLENKVVETIELADDVFGAPVKYWSSAGWRSPQSSLANRGRGIRAETARLPI